MNSYYVTESTTYRFLADSVEEADKILDRIREDGVDQMDGMWVVGNTQLKIVDTSVDEEW